MRLMRLMMLFCAAAAYSGIALSAPFIESDPYAAAVTPKPTLCSVYIDAATTGTDSPVMTDTTGTYCHYDLSALSIGAHTAKAKFAIVDPVWGRQESTFSNTVNFTRPGLPAAPANLIISPN